MIWALAVLAGLALWPVIREARRTPVDDVVRASAPGEFADLSLGRVHYRWLGRPRGPVAICVHGLTTPSFVWEGLVPHLERMGFRVLLYDLYGRGYSSRPEGAQTPEMFTRQLSELLAALGLDEDLTLIGYSMGGVIASRFTAAYPGRVRQLMLVAPADMGIEVSRATRIARDVPVLGDWLFHMAFPRQFRASLARQQALEVSVEDLGDRQAGELMKRGYLRAVLSSLRHSLRRPLEQAHRQIAQAGVPVLAVWGDADETVPLAGLGLLAQWNRNAHQEVIPEATHLLPATHTEALAGHISALTESLRRG
ncbi:alpha/beta fold hydrolase [Litorisediminicola beolgyonensis]|uniref:Alpha/beta fold hydrolase n=1 Tax=Litorisediminicola beolgyonensis TaxID=1173614 RepID=A0ABW3ZMZ9_9RHOB